MPTFRARVHQHLRDTGLSQAEVAKKMGCPTSSLSQSMKSGRFPEYRQRKLAEILTVTMDTLKEWGIKKTYPRGIPLQILDEELFVTAGDLQVLAKMHEAMGDMTIDFVVSVIKECRRKEQKR